MVCSNKGCKAKANIGAKSGLCQSCETFVRSAARKMEHQGRQQHARDASYDAHCDLPGDLAHDDHEDGPSHGLSQPPPPPANNIFNYPSINADQALPEVDISDIIKTCEQAKQGNPIDTGKVLSDICGMMVHMFSKQNENEGLKAKVASNTDRIEQLEAKVGDTKDVAYPRSIAIRKLPLPPLGVTELQNAQHYLKEIRVEGINIAIDAVKAIRKEAAKHNPNLGPNLGTVLLELRSEEIRAKIMKNKKNLEQHPSPVLRGLIIKNALSPFEMKTQNTHNALITMITGGNNHYVAGNGMIYQKNQNNVQLRHPSHTQAPQQPFNQPQISYPPPPPPAQPARVPAPMQAAPRIQVPLPPLQVQQHRPQMHHYHQQVPPYYPTAPQPPTVVTSGFTVPNLMEFDFPDRHDSDPVRGNPHSTHGGHDEQRPDAQHSQPGQ